MNKILKRTLIISGCVLGTIVLAAGTFVGYVILSYSRIGNTELNIDHVEAVKQKAQVKKTYKAISYNIGFGAYSQDYTFFLDTGYDENGDPTCGHYSTAKSKKEVEFNTNGAIKTIQNEDADFAFLQEVDTDSTRSYHIDQDEMIKINFAGYDHMHCQNFHSAFLPYPLYDMHGKVKAGLTTLSNIKLNEGYRHEYTVSSSLSKFFDLDRCFSSSYVEVENGKKLYIVNSHMSAYDEGGEIRTKQVSELNAFLSERKEAGDYVIIGGDWNHDLLRNNPDFSYSNGTIPFDVNKKTPDWLQEFFSDDSKSPLIEGFNVIASDNYATCRNNDIEYEPGKTFTCVVDGFIVSDNIKITAHRNIQTKNGNKGLEGFAYSDHDPALIEFELI